MQAMMIDNELSAAVNEIARELNISQQDILKQAIEDYVKKIKKHQALLAFAGILQENEADDLLATIQQSRVNKTTEFDL
ncbi:MAG: ribbon-helix-helix protein, CopG family [Methylococcaceae bacterium]|nr:ribbon-helix-helix protein, CopG family [Methylococcaceae bacterium]